MSEREWRFYLDDMIAFAEKVLAYSEGLDQQAFIANGLNYDATVRNLELLGGGVRRAQVGEWINMMRNAYAGARFSIDCFHVRTLCPYVVSGSYCGALQPVMGAGCLGPLQHRPKSDDPCSARYREGEGTRSAEMGTDSVLGQGCRDRREAHQCARGNTC
jgi:hypothetical protein